jgi:flagellar biosynthesis GTPase FlhF
MKVSNKNVILHNKYVLYLIFIIALGNLLTLAYTYDYYSVSIFVLIGFLTSFFSKNMIVILFIAIAFTNIIKYGGKASVEGMTSKDSDEKETDSEVDTDEKTNKEKSEKNKETSEKEESEIKKKSKSEKNKSSEALSLSVETNEGSNKEKFEQDKNIVYTSDEDKEMDKTDKMILSQEKILKSMNKYKPLLDTLQGISKNMALVKGATSTADE